MSYSYNDLLNAIITSRQSHPATIDESLSHYGVFSEKCSMTPLLWIQYAQDSRLIDAELAKEIIQLGLEEFPGCVFLWLYYLDCTKDWAVWEQAMQNIKGLQGSFMIEIYRLAIKCFPSKAEELFIERATMLSVGNETIVDEIETVVGDSKKTNGNGIISKEVLMQAVDEGRRFASQHMIKLNNLEEDLVAAMTNEGIYGQSTIELHDFVKNNDGDGSSGNEMTYDWESVLKALGGISGSFLMGMGMMQSASAFISYEQQIFKHITFLKRQMKTPQSDQTENLNVGNLVKLYHGLIVPVYERAVSECPTVELVWEKYLKHLSYILHDSETESADRIWALVKLKSVASRAVNNCPYSVNLFTKKLQAVMEEVEAGRKVLEPDDLMNIVTEAIEAGFLPDKNSELKMYLAACRIVKQRILDLVSQSTSSIAYDQPERIDKDSKKKRKRGEDVELKRYTEPLDSDIEQEVQDLITDLREMWNATDTFLRKKCSNWTEGRQLLFTEIAETEAYICHPLFANDVNGDEIIKLFEKLVRVHLPPHPNSWRSYIQYIIGKAFVRIDPKGTNNIITETPGMHVAKFRFIRNLYQRAFASLRNANKNEKYTNVNDGYEVAVNLMCQENIQFETKFGSDTSLITASKLAAKRVSQQTNVTEHISSEGLIDISNNSSAKRKFEEADNVEDTDEDKTDSEVHSLKKLKSDETVQNNIEKETEYVQEINEKNSASPTVTNKDEKKRGPNIWPIKSKAEHKVKVGNLEYPAHPFTIHISNLSQKTQDMDLYDVFKSKCGAIVHARIFREKEHGNRQNDSDLPKSKGMALVQFEERTSVEEALKLSNEFGLHEKLIKISRSHQPAVAVVPPGCHRIKAKGEGKSTKRNLKRKTRRENKNEEEVNKELKTSGGGRADEINKEIATPLTTKSVLAFRPRNV
eukprot:CAMPEP_0194118592 /NCGR_PEP_ID=MMETSP0150-20130528/36205_1 /TAXON_ID=122233 /ORGANISM="Chaetoceros debilis, Strain MM31A-1" /LENGTH=923 /DNA_ID=CAMNT_0038810029 /DNA_START=54 /DNA_END=2822 /DNA_ORIENTATION=+